MKKTIITNIVKKPLILVLILTSFITYSQEVEESKSSLDLGADIVSRYVWRGLSFSDSPAIQPYVEFASGNFTAGAWASYTTEAFSSQEFDIYLGYAFSDAVSLTVTDYFFPVDGAENKYFQYDNDITGHVFEAMLGFGGTDKFPLSIALATNFYGSDKDDAGDQAFSTYFELGYPISIGSTEVSLTLGGTLTDEGGYYTNNASAEIINIGASAGKTIKISESFGIDASASLIFNPNTENSYLVFGISL